MIKADSLQVAAEPEVVPGARLHFDWIMICLSSWLMLGAHIDAWAHIHIGGLEPFFTPWHAILYSGYAALAGFLVLTTLRNRARGASLMQAVPAGYHVALLGVGIFAFGGLGDMIWHTLFGVEKSLEALLSPTHLVLALAVALMVSGPLRSAWLRPRDAAGLSKRLPEVLSLTFLLALIGYMTQYAHPFGAVRVIKGVLPPDSQGAFPLQALGLLSIILQAAILMGIVLVALRHRPLPTGSLTLTLGLSVVLMTTMRIRVLGVEPSLLIAAGLAGGIASDLLLWVLRPSVERRVALQVFGFAVPAVIYTVYFLTLGATYGIGWSVHFSAGAITLAGIAGWLLTYLVLPPVEHEMPRG